MRKKITSIVLALCMLLSCIVVSSLPVNAVDTRESGTEALVSDVTSAASTGPQNKIQGSAILHCFNWSYNSIKENLKSIKDAGYTAVQTSPVQTPKDYSPSWMGQSDQWWKLYQPVSISIADGGTWLGTKAELQSLCETAESMGIKVIVDIVANHMGNITGNGGNSMDDISTQVDEKLRNNPDYWHINSYRANNDNDRYIMTVGSIGMPDLNTGNSYIQDSFKQLLIDCINLGVDGFRFDAAKHIELPTDTQNKSDFWPTVIDGSKKSTTNEIFYYGEILNGCGTSISNYTKYMSVTDNVTGDSALSAARSNNAAGLANSTYYKGAGADKSVLWAESHDTYMGSSGSTSSVPDSTIVKTWAIVGTRADSTSLFFARPAAKMGDASSDTTWKSPTVTEINKFKNYFAGQSESLSSSGSIAYNERGTEGVVLVNCSSSQTATVDVPAKKMKDGTYTDAVSGSTFKVQGGRIKGEIGSTGVAVVYNGASPTPYAFVTPGSQNYKTDTLELTLTYTNATTGQYSIDNGEYKNYTNGQKITIGKGLPYETITTVNVKASNETSTSEVTTYTYKKIDASKEVRIYFDNSSYHWSNVFVYIYVDDGAIENQVWPGLEMELDPITGYYYYDVQQELVNGYAIFTESSSATTNRYPADGETGMQINNTSKIFRANHSWETYTPSGTEPTTAPKTEPTTAPKTEPTTVPETKPTTVPQTEPTTVPQTKPTNASETNPTSSEPPKTEKILIGDTDLDGDINVKDATLIQLHLARLGTLNKKQLIVSDVDYDNDVNIRDVTYIQMYCAHFSSALNHTGEYKEISADQFV